MSDVLLECDCGWQGYRNELEPDNDRMIEVCPECGEGDLQENAESAERARVSDFVDLVSEIYA